MPVRRAKRRLSVRLWPACGFGQSLLERITTTSATRRPVPQALVKRHGLRECVYTTVISGSRPKATRVDDLGEPCFELDLLLLSSLVEERYLLLTKTSIPFGTPAVEPA